LRVMVRDNRISGFIVEDRRCAKELVLNGKPAYAGGD
jgi:hypothetical protein